MKEINFELTGMLGTMEFKKGADVKLEAEAILREQVELVERVTLCKVINDEFVINIVDMPIDNENEKDITYKFILESDIYSYLSNEQILALIHEEAKRVEGSLSLVVVESDECYDYEIISDSLSFNEAEFVDTICENISNLDVEELSLEIAGFDYTKDALSIEDVISESYKKLTKNEIINFSKSILCTLEKNTNMKYYQLSFFHKNPTEKSIELFGEGGLTWHFKTDLDLDKEDILDKCLKQCAMCNGYADLVESVSSLEDIIEISSEEYYSSAF